MAYTAAEQKALANAAERGGLRALGNLLRDFIDRIGTLSVTELGWLDGITAGTGTASKALVLNSSGDVAMPSTGMFGLSRAALAAAGASATDAAVIATQVVAVTASDGAKGVALPAAATTEGPILVINTVLTSGADLLVYPVNGGNDQINGEAEDAAFTMGPGKAAWFIPTSATQWYVADLSGVTATKAELNTMDGILATTTELNAVADASTRIVTSTDAGTLALTAATHGEKIVNFSDADGTITLPAATGSGVRFMVILATAATAMSITVLPASNDEFMGGVVGVDDDADAAYAWKAEDDDDTISLNGTSTGGKVGDWFRFTDIKTDHWLVEGFITQSGGSEATPFSAGV